MPNPGWYDDPEDATQLRWWSGNHWTDRRMPRDNAGIPTSQEVPPPPAPEDPWGSVPSAGGGGGWGAGGGGGGFGAGASGVGSGWGATPGPGFATVGTGAAPPRTFVDAIKVCLTKYVDGKGRASRSEYWYFALFSLIVDVLTGGVAVILLLLPSITVSVRRLHDIGKSAWAFLWLLVPIVGVFVLLFYAVRPGEPQSNAWG